MPQCFVAKRRRRPGTILDSRARPGFDRFDSLPSDMFWLRALALLPLVSAVFARETVEDAGTIVRARTRSCPLNAYFASVSFAARIARNLVQYSPDAIGYMATTYPSDHDGLAGEPFRMSCMHGRTNHTTAFFQDTRSHSRNTMAGKRQPLVRLSPALKARTCSCHENGSLTLLFMPISRHSQNVLHSPGHAASISIGSAHPAASRARVALIGNVTVFQELALTPERERIEACYIAQHPDARWWLPGPREPHIVRRRLWCTA